MKDRNELMTVNQLYTILNKEIEKGNGEKYIFMNEYYMMGVCEGMPEVPDGESKDTLYFPEIDIHDVFDYCAKTGDIIK